jgi:hypothetical protein
MSIHGSSAHGCDTTIVGSVRIGSKLLDKAEHNIKLALLGCHMDGRGTTFIYSINFSPNLFDQTFHHGDVPQHSGQAQGASEITTDP